MRPGRSRVPRGGHTAPDPAGSVRRGCVGCCESVDVTPLHATRHGPCALLPATQTRARAGLWLADPRSGPKRVTLKRVSRTVNPGDFGCRKRLRVSRRSRAAGGRASGVCSRPQHCGRASRGRRRGVECVVGCLQSWSEPDPKQRRGRPCGPQDAGGVRGRRKRSPRMSHSYLYLRERATCSFLPVFFGCCH